MKTERQAKEAVVRAAMGWTFCNDDGSIAGLMRYTRAVKKLGSTCETLRKIQQAKARKARK